MTTKEKEDAMFILAPTAAGTLMYAMFNGRVIEPENYEDEFQSVMTDSGG